MNHTRLMAARLINKPRVNHEPHFAHGRMVNEEKSQWVPSQLGELLGLTLDLQHGIFQVLARVEALKQLIDTIIDKHFTVSARCLSRLSWSLVSMGLALGPVARLWTRHLERYLPGKLAIFSVTGQLVRGAVLDGQFWQQWVSNLVSQPQGGCVNLIGC